MRTHYSRLKKTSLIPSTKHNNRSIVKGSNRLKEKRIHPGIFQGFHVYDLRFETINDPLVIPDDH